MGIYDVLELIFHRFNDDLFESALGERLDFNDIIFTLERKNKQIGLLSYKQYKKVEDGEATFKHEISLNPEYFAIAPKIDVLRVFCQELTRLYRYVHGEKKKMKTDYYDEYFGEYMMTIGLHPSNTGAVGGKEVGKKMSSYILPDGKFLKVCNALVEEGIILNWFDVDIPSKASVDDILMRVYEVNEELGEDLSPVLLEVPLLQSKNIEIDNLLPCLEINSETKKIEINEAKAATHLVISVPDDFDDVADFEDFEEDENNPTIGRLEGEREWEEDGFINNNLGVGKTMQYTSDAYEDDEDDEDDTESVQIAVVSKSAMADVIGIEPPKQVKSKTKFKYTCGCGQSVVGDRENMRFRCDSCQLAFRCETEKLESIVDAVEVSKPKYEIEGFEEAHGANDITIDSDLVSSPEENLEAPQPESSAK